jgi:hypothetical protein
MWIYPNIKNVFNIWEGKKNRKRVGGREKESPAGVRYLSASFYVNGTGADSFYLHGPLRLNQIGESIMIQPWTF